MSALTPNLNLFKIIPLEDAKKAFNFYEILNHNWDILDNKIKNLMPKVYSVGNANQPVYINNQGQFVAGNSVSSTYSPNGTSAINGKAVASAISDIEKTVSDIKQRQGVITSVNTAYNGYRIWSDGYCEQWGRQQIRPQSTTTITFPQSFINTFYNIFVIAERYSSTDSYHTDDINITINKITNSNIEIYCYDTGTNNYTTYFRWKAYGYIK